MADPHIESELNALDRLSVRLYRFSLVWIFFGWSFSFLLALSTQVGVLERGYYSYWLPFHVGNLELWALAWLQFLLFLIPVGLSLFTLHLYNKRLLWSFRALYLVSIALYTLELNWPNLASPSWLSSVSLGFLLAGASMVSAKEAFCFRFKEGYAFGVLNFALVLGMFLASFWLGTQDPRPIGNWLVIGVLLVNGAMFLSLLIKKFRQPLHYDIGDKSKYS